MDDAEPPPLDPETIHRLLSDPYRRYLLVSLDPGERKTVTELARSIAARNRHDDAIDADAIRRRIEISLVHNHLPRLADHGVIAYAPRERRVMLTDDLESLLALETPIELGPIDS